MTQERINNTSTCQCQSKGILSVKEACSFMDISKSYLYKLTHHKLLPFFCPNGKKIYFKKDDLTAWMLKNHQFSKDEIKMQASDIIKKAKSRSQ
ncbi:DNA-binding protein [Flavipsychrobacter stenotrophus]|uniref:DNA-binding protein n=1 Tax=Flavipsychrobacter stenotrophus TaxID=2077091 RepID=A0A2S7T0B3_9BACT|nr:DNA-binding protein [Flavipsychrobacter stenotrophus]